MSDAKKCGQCQREIPSHAPFGICPVCVLNLATEESSPLVTDSRPAPEVDSVAEPHELVGKFPNLEIVSLLGRGGMGAVYLARQTSLDRIVALKVLSKGLADDPSFTERFAREAKTLAKLTHPNIVTVFDSGQTGDANYLVMEYVEGVNLRDAIVSKTIDPARALAMVQQICDALQHAHDAGVIHRDIKPENILIDRNGLVKIADFGLAKLVQPKPEQYSLTGTQQVLGTRNYMAPEQIESPESVDHRADLYSLGVVLYELLTGELPIGRFAPPSTKTGCSKRLDDLVMRTLEKDPGQRFQQASMIGSAVRELESSVDQLSGKRPLVQEITRSEYVETPVREPLADPLPFWISGLVSKPADRFGSKLHIASACGLMRIYDDRVDLEYRVHDPMYGDESVLKLDSVRLDNLSSVRYEPTWWGGGRLRFKAMSLQSIAKIPKSKQGVFHVKVKNQDRHAAMEFADMTNRKIISRNPQRSGAKRSSTVEQNVTLEDIVQVDERLMVPRIGFLITGVLTLLAGIVLTASLILSFLSPGVRETVNDIVGPAYRSDIEFFLFLGPVWLLTGILPLIAASSLKHHRSYHLAVVIALLMLIPLATALVFVHILLAVWTLIVLVLPVTRRVFRDASLRDRMAVEKKPPVLKRIPRTVFVLATVFPILLGVIAYKALVPQMSGRSGTAGKIVEYTVEHTDGPRVVYEKDPAFSNKHVVVQRHTMPEESTTVALEATPASTAPQLSTSISKLGLLGIAFVGFAMLLVLFVLAILASKVFRSKVA